MDSYILLLLFQHSLSDLRFHVFAGNPVISWAPLELLFIILFGVFYENEILLYVFFSFLLHVSHQQIHDIKSLLLTTI